MYSMMDTGRIMNASKMDLLLNMYSTLQIIERMYNNYYRHMFWPSFLQGGVMVACLSSALCLSKWEMTTSDPRLIMLILAMVNSSMACTLYPYCASKVNTASGLFLNRKCRDFYNICIRKRLLSKPTLSIKISDNFMDSEFPLSVSMFCVNNIFSLVVIFRTSG